MRLQVNTSGAWRNVVDFPADRRDDVLRGVVILARVMGTTAKWSFLMENGRREWLGSLSDAIASSKE